MNSLKHVLLIYRESFGGNAGKKIKKYCKLFNHTFYILKYDGDVVGYCIYYIHIKLENLKLIKKATLYSIAITHKERKKGFAKILLKESINELKFNNISKIALYVDCKNQAAINLYKSYGFIIIGETENICGLKKNCYLMELCFKD
ncbi:GNAT family N-acetyltransferase [Methanoplanus limicola]|uniref:GNAT family N-acetyltransferase n=1 Tax=Methanoplanus limicola TaxID=2315 RepID=UPI001C279B91|nr:GNAT family N-acetyltransferase [Methanoplanus limicola]